MDKTTRELPPVPTKPAHWREFILPVLFIGALALLGVVLWAHFFNTGPSKASQSVIAATQSALPSSCDGLVAYSSAISSVQAHMSAEFPHAHDMSNLLTTDPKDIAAFTSAADAAYRKVTPPDWLIGYHQAFLAVIDAYRDAAKTAEIQGTGSYINAFPAIDAAKTTWTNEKAGAQARCSAFSTWVKG